MRTFDRNQFLDESIKTLDSILSVIEDLPCADIKEFDHDKTVLIIIDMVNGFTRQGALRSERIEGLIPEIVKLVKSCWAKNIPALAFADSHDENCAEFESYPPHCIRDSFESEIVDEIKEVGGYVRVDKNSTNCFLEEEFEKWLENNPGINNFIICGDCTDICIMQFALILKGYFNLRNIKTRITVPINAVDTYDIKPHDGDLMNIFALYNMHLNGVELVNSIKY